MHSFPSVAFVWSLVFACPVVAQTFVVDASNGPGTNFTSIAAAIAAVPDGASIQVRPGQYAEPSLAINGRSLSILGGLGVVVTLPASVPVRVDAVAASQQVVLRGLVVRWAQTTSVPTVQCGNNRGRVLLEALGSIHDTLGLVAWDCDWLVAADCQFLDGGVQCANARVVLDQCAIRRNGVVVVQTGGSVQLSETTIVGAMVYGPGLPPPTYLMQGGEVWVSDDSNVSGGGVVTTGQRGLCFTGYGTARVDPGALLSGAVPLIPPTIVATTTLLPHLTTTRATLGGIVYAELHGPVGHLGALTVGFAAPQSAVPGLVDLIWFVPGAFVTQTIGVPAAMQPLTSSIGVPNSQDLNGLILVWHGFTYAATAGFQVSNPSVRVLHP